MSDNKVTPKTNKIGEFHSVTNEFSRTYVFPSGEITVSRVTRICVRPSGTHRLETAEGGKYIIPTGWIAIKIDASTWSL